MTETFSEHYNIKELRKIVKDFIPRKLENGFDHLTQEQMMYALCQRIQTYMTFTIITSHHSQFPV